MNVSFDRKGRLIDDRYRVGELIGRGSMGVVHVGLDERTGHRIALKFLEMPDESAYTDRQFLRSAHLASTIRHRNVVSTLDFGRWKEDDHSCYLVMELVRGASLSALSKAGLDMGAYIGLMNQVLQALAHMHARNVLHLDIKPDNLLVEQLNDGTLRVKVTDFGLAAAIERSSLIDVQTANGQLAGTPLYMAPELVTQAGAPKPRADLYAIGVILYELFTGETPFVGTPLELMLAKTQRDPPVLMPHSGIHPEVATIVHRLLARDPAERFQHAVDVLEVLRPFAKVAVACEIENLLDVVATAPTLLGLEALSEATMVQSSNVSDSGRDVQQFWGRDDLIEEIENYLTCLSLKRGGILLLDSEVGMGASALMHHMNVRLSEEGRCQCLFGDYGRVGGRAFGLRQAIEGFLGTAGLEVEDVEAVVAVHLEQFGIDDPAILVNLVDFLRPQSGDRSEHPRSRNAELAAVFKLLRAASRERPVFLALDELHEAGVAAVALLEYAKNELAMSPFPIIVCATVAADHRGGVKPEKWNQLALGYEDIVLRMPVGPIEQPLLAESIRQVYGLQVEQAYRIAELSGGSPTIAMQLADGCKNNHDLIDVFETSSHSHHALVHSLLTPTVSKILTRRLESRLAHYAQHDTLVLALENMSILGATVSYDLFANLLETSMPQVLPDTVIDTLVQAGVLAWNEAFDHEVVSMVPEILGTLLRERMSRDRKRELHRLASQSYLNIWHQDTRHVAGEIGEHCALAGELADAKRYWYQAFHYERTHGNPMRAVEFGQRLIDELADDDGETVRIGLEVASLLLDAGLIDEAEKYAARFVESAGADDAMCAGEILADCYENRGEAEAWRSLLELLALRLQDTSPRGERAYLRSRSMYANSYGQSRAGLTDALMALESAPPGHEAQRAAQRAVYCCLSMGKPKMGEPYARKAVSEAGDEMALRVRSLRALGVVLTWLGKHVEAIRCHEETLSICSERGFQARMPIAYHDLGDAHRMAGHGQAATEAYDIALHHAQRLALGHTRQLVRVKQVMCQLTDGQTAGVIQQLSELAPEALEAGLGLAVPFCALLEAWAYAQDGDLDECAEALKKAGRVKAFAVDPQLPVIVEAIGDVFMAHGRVDYASSLYSQAGEVWALQDAKDHVERCTKKGMASDRRPDLPS